MIQRAEERMRAGKTAQCSNALATKPDDPSLILGSRIMVEKEKR